MNKFKKNSITIIIITAIIGLLIKFIREAYEAGRLPELLISVPSLVGVYYLLFLYGSIIPGWTFLIPVSVFILYWCILFSHEKVTSLKADSNWINREWWWKLDGWEFEEEVAKVFRLNGYKAKVTKKTSDGGIDILMYKDKKKIIAQCKHYSSPVAVSVARELNGLRDDFRADELILVASSGVTKACIDFIRNKPYFHILDLEDIIRMGLRPNSYKL